jgi:hypothetical protein
MYPRSGISGRKGRRKGIETVDELKTNNCIVMQLRGETQSLSPGAGRFISIDTA